MDIRVNPKYYAVVNEAYKKSKFVFQTQVANTHIVEPNIALNIDADVDTAVMVLPIDGKLTPWWVGVDAAVSYLQYGYVRVLRKCPHRFFRGCIGETCAWSRVHNSVHDCAIIWASLK